MKKEESNDEELETLEKEPDMGVIKSKIGRAHV